MFYAKTAATVVYSWNKDGDVSIRKVGIGTATPDAPLAIVGSTLSGKFLTISGSNDDTVVDIDPTISPSITTQILRFVPIIDPQGAVTIPNIFGVNVNLKIGGSGSLNISTLTNYAAFGSFQDSYSGTINTIRRFFAADTTDTSSGSPVVTNQYGLFVRDLTFATNNWGIYVEGSTMNNFIEGRLGVGENAPTAKLHVDQASTTAAIPAALFDQADISEEMFEFVSTIGTGNAIEAVGAKALTVTHFIKVTSPGSLTRYLEVGTIA